MFILFIDIYICKYLFIHSFSDLCTAAPDGRGDRWPGSCRWRLRKVAWHAGPPQACASLLRSCANSVPCSLSLHYSRRSGAETCHDCACADTLLCGASAHADATDKCCCGSVLLLHCASLRDYTRHTSRRMMLWLHSLQSAAVAFNGPEIQQPETECYESFKT